MKYNQECSLSTHGKNALLMPAYHCATTAIKEHVYSQSTPIPRVRISRLCCAQNKLPELRHSGWGSDIICNGWGIFMPDPPASARAIPGQVL